VATFKNRCIKLMSFFKNVKWVIEID